jgi:hypothetical protein
MTKAKSKRRTSSLRTVKTKEIPADSTPHSPRRTRLTSSQRTPQAEKEVRHCKQI